MLLRFSLIVMIVLLVVVMVIDGIPILGTLTEHECKAYFTSDDINQRLQAMFVCPKKWRPKAKKVESLISKRAIKKIENSHEDEEIDDFYLFW